MLTVCLFSNGQKNEMDDINAYAWMDGTTAPFECVSKCQASGLETQNNYKNGIHYITDECKLVCYGNSAIVGVPISEEKETLEKIDNKAKNNVQTNKENTNYNRINVNSENNSAREQIQEQFKEQVQEIAKNGTPMQKGEQISQERHDTNERIALLIRNETQIDYSGMNGTGVLRIRARDMTYENTTIDVTQKTIYANVNGKRIKINQQATNVKVTDSAGKSIEAYEADIDGRNLKINGWQVEVMPSEALSAVGAKDGAQIEIDANAIIEPDTNTPKEYAAYYTITEKTNAKIFGVIDASYELKSSVDAQSGNAVIGKKPWWIFLATEEK
jgi:hypothetical protein